MGLFIQNLLFIFIWIYVQYHLSDGFLWIKKPNEYTLVKLGSNITIKWHYRMQENETFYYSEIEDIALRLHVDKSFELLKTFYDPFVKVSGKWNVNLTIINATQQRNKKYCCWITFERNGKTAKTRNCTTLEVYDPPRILYNTPDKLLIQTSNFTLRCTSSGVPIPILHWEKDNIYKFMGNSSNVFVTITGKESEGKYCCHAKNEYGDDTACTTVNVTEYQPTKTILTTNTNYTIKHRSLRILCWAEASPPANYLIYQGKIKLGYFTSGNVTITASNGTNENISCISKNKYGEETPVHISIPIYELPVLIRQPNAWNNLTISYITLHCKATGIPRPTITWLDDKNNTLNQTSTEKRNDSLQISHRNCSNNTLRYYCEASNTVGRTRSSLITIQVIRYSNTDMCSSSKVIVNTEKPTVYETSINIKILVVVFICVLGILIMVLILMLCLRKKKQSKDIKKTNNQREVNEKRKFASERTSVYNEPVEGHPVSTDVGIRSEQPEPNVSQKASVKKHTVSIPLYESVEDSASTPVVNTQLQEEDQIAKHNPISAITRVTIQKQRHPTPAEPTADIAVSKKLPENATTYQPVGLNIHEYSSLSSFTRLPKENKLSSGKSHEQGIELVLTNESEYQALGEKAVVPEYQSLYDLNRC